MRRTVDETKSPRSPIKARAVPSKKAKLVALRRLEQVGPEPEPGLRKAKFLSRFLKAGTKKVGPGTLTLHPTEEIRIVVSSTAKGADGRHHLACSVGEMLIQPGTKQRRAFVRQSDWQIETAASSCRDTGLDDSLQFVVG